MSSHKRLKSVAHSLAHHAVSALSYVHPHLSESCEREGLSSIEIDLMAANSCPKQFLGNKPLELSLNELKVTLNTILESEGFKINDLKSIILEFSFYHGQKDHYCSNCKATLYSTECRLYERTVNYMGDTIST